MRKTSISKSFTDAVNVFVPPNDWQPAGYGHFLAQYPVEALPPAHFSFISTTKPQKITQNWYMGYRRCVVYETFSPQYLQTKLTDHVDLIHLLFAIKHDGIDLLLIKQIFIHVPHLKSALEQAQAQTPMGKYIRILCFLYEFLLQTQLQLTPINSGNYIFLLDEDAHYTNTKNPPRCPRTRVVNNLLGDVSAAHLFCPIVRRSEELQRWAKTASDISARVGELYQQHDASIWQKATSYLYTKETMSSFALEAETPTPSRAERFSLLLKQVYTTSVLSKNFLCQLQNITVADTRFYAKDYRDSQVYVGEMMHLSMQKIHYIAPKPDDVPALMHGLVHFANQSNQSSDPTTTAPTPDHVVAMATILSFAFVFVHPFDDGNGRIHRFLLHYGLRPLMHSFSQQYETYQNIILPISAVILQEKIRYDEILESFSRPLLEKIQFTEAKDGSVTVHNHTLDFYRFIDFTDFVIYIYQCIWKTIDEEMPKELNFLTSMQNARRELSNYIDMPDRLMQLFISFVWQNQGSLSKRKYHEYFSMFTEEEIKKWAAVVDQYRP